MEEKNIETLTGRFNALKAKHPGLHLMMGNSFTPDSRGSYPVYKQLIYAPFISMEGKSLMAGVVVELTKAEWQEEDKERRDRTYQARKAQMVHKLLDWVEDGVVPVNAGGEDQVKVREWGDGKGSGKAEGPKIQLTDQE